MRCFAVLAVAVLACGFSRTAHAADDCPEGDWFCEPAPDESQAPPAAQRDASPPSGRVAPPPGTAPAPRDDERMRIDVEQVRPARKRRHFKEWGVNVHGAVGLLGTDSRAANDSGMGGLGVALRFRPIPHLASEGSLELMWGTDYNGFARFEDALLASALVYANPRSAVQLYGLAGFGLAGAWIDWESGDREDDRYPRADDTYSYVGVQLGVGVEARVTRRFGLGADLIGFVRERSDRYADRNPEFVDATTHRATNTSGGGLVRLGATLYW